ncbi:hypothetical protein IV417_04220 [Alphaproteobacteria bacterium KMM 3653]|uniref:Glyoxalase-related protein domain-containing protein n=1 Tax=Harenicola maris TaxID=2841044 RepID=A0AAP2CN07_9RHOB|nr:hypothetical protein [Harenicola maris]
MKRTITSLAEAKAQARRLRAEAGEMSHSAALEAVAKAQGYRDWNTLSAALGQAAPAAWAAGGRVRGSYLSQPFAASVTAARQVEPGWYHLSLDLDEAVDVVAFDSFSNMRKRIDCVVGPAGTSCERTSDGQPHMVLEL